MSKKFLLIAFSFLMLLGGKAFAQADDQLVQVGNEMYNFGDVKDALEVFKQALEINPKNIKANFMAGRCYIETINKDKSLPYFLKAYQLDPQVADNILYLIGHAYHLGYKFDDAIDYYKQYINALPSMNVSDDKKIDEIKKADHKIAECNVAKELVKNPDNIVIENLGPTVNSVDEDYAPAISADESLLFFTSRRAGSTGEKKDNDNEFFEDIYVTHNDHGNWNKPENLGKPVNSELHDACIGISPDGKQLFIYKDNNKYKGDIFFCKLDKNGKWSDPSPMSKKINTDFIEKAITISTDGKVIFFSSNRPGGLGGMDLYMSKLKSNGDWEDPVNLGSPINSPQDDDCPFLASDNKTLYFSSKGHKGMGGFDVYKSLRDEKNGWSEPENLRYPINSPDDDKDFVLSGDGKYGYYASIKQDEVGDVDIYKIHMPETSIAGSDSSTHKQVVKTEEKKVIEKPVVAEKPLVKEHDIAKTEVELKPVTINIKVVNKKGDVIPAEVEIIEAVTSKHLTTNASNGNYTHDFMNHEPMEYIVTAQKEGFIFKSQRVKIAAASAKGGVINQTLELEEVKVGARRILKNIYFDYNQATITKNSDAELHKLYNLLEENPKVKVEIDGHTDSYGSKIFNIYLSQKRAEAVVHWLIGKGINGTRLTAKGFGEEMPLASNDDEQEGRELNRRTEFVIVSK